MLRHTHTHKHTHRCADTHSFKYWALLGTHTQDTHICTLRSQRTPYGTLRPPLSDTPGSTLSLTQGPISPEASPSQTRPRPCHSPLYSIQMVFFKPHNHSFGSIGLEKIETYGEIKSDRYAERHPGVSLPDTLRDTQACSHTHPHPRCSHRHSCKIRHPLSSAGLLETLRPAHKPTHTNVQIQVHGA